MRSSIAGIVVAMLSIPAHALGGGPPVSASAPHPPSVHVVEPSSPSTLQQYEAANGEWLGALGDAANYSAHYPTSIADGLTGLWADVGALALAANDAAKLEQECSVNGYRVLAKTPLSIKLVLNAGEDSQVTYGFTSMGGNSYMAVVDKTELYHLLQLNGDVPELEFKRLQAIGQRDGVSQIFRPSPDIMIIQTNKGVPRVFARCGGR